MSGKYLFAIVLRKKKFRWRAVSVEEVKNVMRHLRRKVAEVNKASVGKILGVEPEFK